MKEEPIVQSNEIGMKWQYLREGEEEENLKDRRGKKNSPGYKLKEGRSGE